MTRTLDPPETVRDVSRRRHGARAGAARRSGETAPRPAALCPGKRARLRVGDDLEPRIYRRLVARRARALLDEDVAVPETEEARRALEERILEKVHDVADFLPAHFLARGAERARAVCRIVVPMSGGRSFGTGFLIAPGVLMTNHHVLEDAEQAADALAEFHFDRLPLSAGSVAAGVASPHGDPRTAPITAAIRPDLLFVTDAQLDYTIVACDGIGLETVKPIALSRDPTRVTRFERVNVIQHPQGRPKEVALHDNRVERVQSTLIHYRTDTEPGSSGSPVLNNEWELVALHHAGWPEGGGKAMNEGVAIPAIVDDLALRLPGLPGEATAGRDLLREVLAEVEDSSPFLGFFDAAGIGTSGTEVQVDGFTGTEDFADVGVWNIEHFNDSVADRRVRDVAEVVDRLKLDVLGLTEVERGALERLSEELLTRGSRYGFEVADVVGSQDLAVLFDADTTTVVARDDIAQRHATALAATTAGGKTVFPRRPLFAECRIGGDDGANEVRFLFIVVHLKAFGDAVSAARRRAAAATLAAIIQDVRQSEGLAVVLGGDFNDRIDTDVLAAVRDSPDLFALTVDDASTDAISFVGSSHRSLIDHVLVSRDVRLGDIQGDDAAIVRLDRSVRDFSDRVSDHVPIVFRVVLRDQPVDVDGGDRPPAGDGASDSPPVAPHEHRVALPRDVSALRLVFERGGG